MTDITILSDSLESSKVMTSNISLLQENINEAVVHQVVKAFLASRRAGTASTKTRAFVSGGGAKPFKQKGTGRARQGSNRSGLMVGGARVFGPLPRKYTEKVNKKMMLVALQSILADKFQAGKLTVVESLIDSGKTKDMFNLLNDKGLLPALIVTQKQTSLALRAVKNIKNAFGISVDSFNTYKCLKYENLVIEEEALITLLSRLG